METFARHRVDSAVRLIRSRFVNRDDRFGAYGSDGHPLTGTRLEDSEIRRLVRGGNPIGLHAVSRENTSKWLCLDVDRHGDESLEAARSARDAIVSHLRSRGLSPVCEQTGGGFHVWCLFPEPIPSAEAYNLAQEARSATDYPAVDCFPNAPTSDHTPKRCGGGWVRLPGRHHRRDELSRVNGVSGIDAWRQF